MFFGFEGKTVAPKEKKTKTKKETKKKKTLFPASARNDREI